MNLKKVYVGLSGGVDSSVSAALLKQAGYDVTGVYMKNWSKPIGRYDCPWEEDYRDAKKVASYLDIPFLMYDFEDQYFDKVVKYMLEAFEVGLTPNPDIMCNQEIKFKLFLDTAINDGADMIATGHYARTESGHLLKAKDQNKDQTYFLYRISTEALKNTLFPIGDLTKPEVRKLATDLKLPTAGRKESMGICFVGKVGIKDFLKQYLPPQNRGLIINQHGLAVGEHDGAIFYTIGQRSGLGVGGGLPYYVCGKNMQKNEVYVTSDLSDESLWDNEISLTSVHFIDGTPPKEGEDLFVRTRHRSPLIKIIKIHQINSGLRLVLSEKVRALTPGQSAVIYNQAECLGGGIIC